MICLSHRVTKSGRALSSEQGQTKRGMAVYNPEIHYFQSVIQNYLIHECLYLCRNGRLQYATELSQYISVDIYGACGTMKCPRSESGNCNDLLRTKYKFYLAFENSNCEDYITEKFFVNGLG